MQVQVERSLSVFTLADRSSSGSIQREVPHWKASRIHCNECQCVIDMLCDRFVNRLQHWGSADFVAAFSTSRRSAGTFRLERLEAVLSNCIGNKESNYTIAAGIIDKSDTAYKF